MMIELIEYNWQVRDEWFDWCATLSDEQLHQKQVGGAGSILYTLFHIVEVENSWLRAIQRKEDIPYSFTQYDSLERVKNLSDTLRKEHVPFLTNGISTVLEKDVEVPWDHQKYLVKDILNHLLVHEVHHIGQLSIWARQLHKQPIDAHFVGREIKSLKDYLNESALS